MLELLILFAYARKLRDILNEKGRSNGWIALGVVAWIGGEILGLVIGTAAGFSDVAAYGLAILFAVAGCTVSYVVIKGLAPARAFEELLEMQPSGAGIDARMQDPSNPFNPPRG